MYLPGSLCVWLQDTVVIKKKKKKNVNEAPEKPRALSSAHQKHAKEDKEP